MLVNLTPHPVILYKDGTIIADFQSQGVARVATEDVLVGTIPVNGHEVEVLRTAFGMVTGLPKPQAGTYYIVSMLVAQAAKHKGRTDLLVPAGTVRDERGRIMGCTHFVRL